MTYAALTPLLFAQKGEIPYELKSETRVREGNASDKLKHSEQVARKTANFKRAKFRTRNNSYKKIIYKYIGFWDKILEYFLKNFKKGGNYVKICD